MKHPSRPRRRPVDRAFTLIELIIVVAIIGVMAALALVGYKKYMLAAGSSEAATMIQNIRAAEESYRGEMFVYLGCTSCGPTGCPQGQIATANALTKLYPQGVAPNSAKYAWANAGHSDYACWKMLNVASEGPVRFGYSVVAGLQGQAAPTGAQVFVSNVPAFPNPTLEPWYVVQAAGDRDNDTKYAYFIASSFTGQVYFENEME